MSWITPFTNWVASLVPLPSDFNRIEGDIDYLKSRGDADRTLTLLGDVSGSAVYNDNGGMDLSVTVKDNSHSHVSSDISDGQSAATPNSVMLRDSSGNTAVNILTAERVDSDISGNAATATKADKLSAARIISLTGNATGSASFDGSQNISINVNVNHASEATDSVKLGGYYPTHNTGGIPIADGVLNPGLHAGSAVLALSLAVHNDTVSEANVWIEKIVTQLVPIGTETTWWLYVATSSGTKKIQLT